MFESEWCPSRAGWFLNFKYVPETRKACKMLDEKMLQFTLVSMASVFVNAIQKITKI